VRRFPATAYLAPEPAEPFIALTEALIRTFPEFPPFRGEHESIVPHLTVANGNANEADAAAAELQAVVQSKGPIFSFCSSVSLLENSSGHWREMHVFALPRQDG
jgi:2'-5' RNA ligase